QGPLLAGFFLKDAPEYEDWLALERQSCEKIAVAALTDMAEYYLQHGRFELAGQAAHRQTEIDPYREIAYRQNMRCLAMSGQRNKAVKYYENLCSLLDRELGVKPEADTISLYDRIYQENTTVFDLEESRGQFSPGEPVKSIGSRSISVFVGRKRELSLLTAGFAQALKGHGQVMFVAGEAGWGKTALMDTFIQQIRQFYPHVVVAIGHGNASTGIGDPYLPFREILEFLAGDVEGQWAGGAIDQDQAYHIWKMMPSVAQTIMEVGPDLIDTFLSGQTLLTRVMAQAAKEGAGEPAWIARLRQLLEQKAALLNFPAPRLQKNLFEQYTHVLQKLAGQTPLVLVLDDLQWLDTGSASLLFHLGKRLGSSQIMLVGAYRPTDLLFNSGSPISHSKVDIQSTSELANISQPSSPPTLRERHPLEFVINELKRDGGSIEIMLAQAEDGFTDALIDSQPNTLSREFRVAFLNRTQGHPLFAVELLQSMAAGGGLIKDKHGRLIESSALDWDILPARVEAVIAERLGRLPKRLLDVLQVASVEGEVFMAEVAAQVLGVDENEIVRWLSVEIGKEHRLARSEGVRWQGSQRLFQYRFDHILFQKYLYTTLDPFERAHWHGMIGSTMENLFGDSVADMAVSLSWHFEKAENKKKAIHYLNLAGERALRLSANQEGLSHFTRALDLLSRLPDSLERAGQELTLQINLAVAILALRSYADAKVGKAFSRAYDLCKQIGNPPQAFLVMWQLACYRSSQADFIKGAAIMQELIELGEQAKDPLLIALGHWGKGWSDFWIGDYVSCKRNIEVMIDFYEPAHHQHLAYLYSQDPGATSRAILAIDLLALGYPDQAIETGRSAVELARQIQHPFSLALTLTYVGMVYGFAGLYMKLQKISEEVIEITRKYDFPYWYSAGLHQRGWALGHLGQAEKGIRDLSQTLNILRASEVAIGQGIVCLAMAEIMAQNGKPAEALGLINQQIASSRQIGELFFVSEQFRVKAEILLKLHPTHNALAETAFLESIDLARGQSARFLELKSSLGLARLWTRLGKSGQAHLILSKIYNQFTEGFELPDLQEARQLLLELEGRRSQ
ncbi:MAG: BTAD domain-containing putative transcriptional regulator, partial [Anaerolineaceae bacterium]|nr:BTAD domain-containing putative transcriptional regulator [Anaerolineaceae bacterium]